MRSLAGIALFLAACSPEAPPPPPPAPPPPAPVDLIHFEVPAGWVSEKPAISMRKAQYRVPDKEKQGKDAEFVVTNSRVKVPIEDNIARWSGQMGGTEGKLEKVTGFHAVNLVDFTGPYAGDLSQEPLERARMLVAEVDTAEGPWYFKLVGPADTVGDWRDEFVALLKGASKR